MSSTHVVSNGKTPYDLDLGRAARDDALGEPFAFRVSGETFAILPMKSWRLDVQYKLAQGDLAAVLPSLLVGGEESYERLLATGMTIGDLEQLFDVIGKWSGVETLPNSVQPPQRASTQT